MNVINGTNMWDEQDENGDDNNDVPIVQRGSSSNSQESSSLPSSPADSGPTDDSIFEEQDENSLPKASSQAAPIELPTKTRLQIKVKKLHVVAEWKWLEGGDDSCGICRMPFEACCVDCQMPGDGCPLVLGACKHPFHMHCIVKWTESQNAAKPQCPLCRQEWRFQ